jgi:PAS domain-containing protein
MSTVTHFETLGAALAGNRHSAIIYARADGGIGFWNAGAEALFGHSPEEVLGKRVDLIVPESGFRADEEQFYQGAKVGSGTSSPTWSMSWRGPIDEHWDRLKPGRLLRRLRPASKPRRSSRRRPRARFS